MDMDFLTSRRPPATYGKTARKKPLVHDFFAYRGSPDARSGSSSPHAHSSAVIGKDALAEKVASSQQAPLQTETSDEQDSLASADESAFPNPRPVSTNDGDFDFDTSDEGNSIQKNRAGTIQARRLARSVRPSENTRKVATVPLARKSRHNPINRGRPTVNREIDSKAEQRPQSTASIGPTQHQQDKTNLEDISFKKQLAQFHTTAHPTLGAGSEYKKRRSDLTEDNVVIDDYDSHNVSGHATDSSTHSLSSPVSTPKRRRLQKGTLDLVSSPSQLELRALRLTSGGHATAKSDRSVESTEDDETPRKPRPRLVDRLDAPVLPAESMSSRQPVSTEEESIMTGNVVTKSRQRDERRQAPLATLQDSNLPSTTKPESPPKPQTKATYATKARTTYAKERSHLSDMVDNLDAFSVPATRTLAPAPSLLASQMELDEDENDDEGPATKLKSIHELRQAGANTRFDREVLSLLEDIETGGAQARSLRLQAIMKLSRRLSDADFSTHFVSIGMIARLSTGPLTADLPSSALFVILFWILSKADINRTASEQILSALLVLLPSVLDSSGCLLPTLRHRRHNLSKLMLKDLIDFEAFITEAHHPMGDGSKQLYPSQLLLAALDATLRRLIKQGGSPSLKATVSFQIFSVINTHVDLLQADRAEPQHMTMTLQALSLLEVCALAMEEAKTSFQALHYDSLGNSLARLMQVPTLEATALQQSVLRAVVSLSNNHVKRCQLLGRTPIIEAVFDVIDRQFWLIVDQAEKEQEIDQMQLDSVILALGCLLNFTECDGETRRRLATAELAGPSGTTPAARLVGLFNAEVSQVQDATSQEQSQVLVAFGYLSMLLCTLSLDASTRQQITLLLVDRSFGKLCDAAETFFGHLRTLEKMSDEDGSMSTFTARFSTILHTVRTAASS